MVRAYAIIENNVVVNRILATEEFMQELNVTYTDNQSAQIGCTLINGVWTPPVTEQEV